LESTNRNVKQPPNRVPRNRSIPKNETQQKTKPSRSPSLRSHLPKRKSIKTTLPPFFYVKSSPLISTQVTSHPRVKSSQIMSDRTLVSFRVKSHHILVSYRIIPDRVKSFRASQILKSSLVRSNRIFKSIQIISCPYHINSSFRVASSPITSFSLGLSTPQRIQVPRRYSKCGVD